jgi:hypothetical protein
MWISRGAAQPAPLDIKPMVVRQPQSRTNVVGSTVAFRVTATGTPLLTYRWLKDGDPLSDGGRIAGASEGILTISDLQLTDAASYSVTITNTYGSTTSDPAGLVVETSPAILSQPQLVRVSGGGSATFSVQAAGAPPLSYQWRRDGNVLSDDGRIQGVTSPSLVIDDVRLADVARYSVIVSNASGGIVSGDAGLILTNFSYTLDLPSGFSLIAVQVHYPGGNTLSEILPTVPDGTLAYKYNGSSYNSESFDFGVWSMGGTTTIRPGEGAYLFRTATAS